MLGARKLASLFKASVSAQGSHADQEGSGQQERAAVTHKLIAQPHQRWPKETAKALETLQAAKGCTLTATAEATRHQAAQ